MSHWRCNGSQLSRFGDVTPPKRTSHQKEIFEYLVYCKVPTGGGLPRNENGERNSVDHVTHSERLSTRQRVNTTSTRQRFSTSVLALACPPLLILPASPYSSVSHSYRHCHTPYPGRSRLTPSRPSHTGTHMDHQPVGRRCEHTPSYRP